MSDELQQTIFAISQAAYEAGSKEEGMPQTENVEVEDTPSSGDDDVIDAEFTKQ